MKTNREYIILSFEPKTYEMLKDLNYNLTKQYFMRIKENSKLGKEIKKEAMKEAMKNE